jgi:hypothetical protein
MTKLSPKEREDLLRLFKLLAKWKVKKQVPNLRLLK